MGVHAQSWTAVKLFTSLRSISAVRGCYLALLHGAVRAQVTMIVSSTTRWC